MGARSIPVVSKGDKWVFAQVLGTVSDFLGLGADTKPQLSPAELAERLDLVLTVSQRLVAQIPDEAVGHKLRNRDRTYRVLCHHIFRIAESFLDVTNGAAHERDMITSEPPDDMQSFAQILDYGRDVQMRMKTWWATCEDRDCSQVVPTYYGDTPLHFVLERTAWHCAQHARQIDMMLGDMGIESDGPLTQADLEGLPVPEKVWDD